MSDTSRSLFTGRQPCPAYSRWLPLAIMLLLTLLVACQPGHGLRIDDETGGRAAVSYVRQSKVVNEGPREVTIALSDQNFDLAQPGLLPQLLFLTFAVIFLAAAAFAGRKVTGGFNVALRVALPHLAGLWVPLAGSVLILYLFVQIGLTRRYDVYQTSPEHAGELGDLRWLVFVLWLVGLWELLQFGRRLVGLYMANRPVPSFAQTKTLAMLVVGLGASYIVVKIPFSVLLIAPCLLWLFIGGRSGLGRLLDWLLFLAGGLVVFALTYYFSFRLLDIDLASLWHVIAALAIWTISFPTAMVLTAILAAGLSLVVKPPIGRRRTEERRAAAAAADSNPTTDPTHS